MKVLVIDNYDSFTYNLVQYLGELGAEPDVLRNDRASVDELLARAPHRVVISPGPCRPTDAGVSIEAARRFPEAGIPGGARPRRDHQPVGTPIQELRDRGLVVSDHVGVRPQLAQVLDQVVGEAVVVVDHENLHGHSGWLTASSTARNTAFAFVTDSSYS